MWKFEEFKNKDASFWTFIKFISETLGYTERSKGCVKAYTTSAIDGLCRKSGIPLNYMLINDAVSYSELRAHILNNFARQNLMNANSACQEYNKLYRIYKQENLKCELPANKQKGNMKQIAYFTAIINILTELTIRSITGDSTKKGFDDNPQKLAYIRDEDGNLIGASSRRFDGAFPSIESPKAVWEIKEYYYTTTFGSRIADGVYETQLDGFEFKELYDRTGRKVYHVLFIDAYDTWWKKGKSYLCRIVDALNAGLVDEVIVGKEVFSRWPELLRSIAIS